MKYQLELSVLNKNGNFLHAAVLEGDEEKISALIDQGFNVNEEDFLNRTPIFYAAQANNVKAALLLISRGALLNIGSNESPLHLATRSGNTDVALALIENGADVDAKNSWGGSALHYASNNGLSAVVEVLIEYGADVDAKTDDHLKTPLHFLRDDMESAKLLINAYQMREIEIPEDLLGNNLIIRAQRELNDPKMVALCTFFKIARNPDDAQVKLNPHLIEDKVIGIVKGLLGP